MMGKQQENYGDLLSKYLVEKISGKRVRWVQPKKIPWFSLPKLNYLGVGSIIHHATKRSIVWGSGIIDQKQEIASAAFRAVRGPKTRDYLIKHGYDCPEVYGDPALLLPDYFCPEVEKEFKLGIIPHYNDYSEVKSQYLSIKNIQVVNMMTDDIEKTTTEILKCEYIIASSLHGLIISHTYGIPGVWVEFSDKIFGDGVKYEDYLKSVDLPVYEPPFLQDMKSLDELYEMINELPNIPKPRKIQTLKKGLLRSCPFSR